MCHPAGFHAPSARAYRQNRWRLHRVQQSQLTNDWFFTQNSRAGSGPRTRKDVHESLRSRCNRKVHRAHLRSRSCPPSVSYRFDRPSRRHCNPFTKNCPISMRCCGRQNGVARKALPGGVHHRCREQPGGRSGGGGFIDICGCDLRLWRALCGPAIHLVGSWWRGYIFFGLDVKPDEFYLQACCPLVRTRQNPSAFHRFAWPPMVKRITQSS